ncbi:2Fe-2S iron-sulfur cluster-binding protein [Bryobacter aggregatus]|uniref:2Fe-2S iron-sulfur cluster-binding protein n=1 Tax=Bryobacter aggregatus TaxID=360054 RepID=UPI0004E16A2E|nr:2Fe-2S iron-sulfur cluster-binding protein [Bryobacter aggregatus]
MWPEILPELAERFVFFQLKGQSKLAQQANTSHAFLDSHRFWGAVRLALDEADCSPLESRIRSLARRSGAPVAHALPMAAIALRTVELCGPDFLKETWTPPADRSTERASRYAPSLLERMKGRKACDRVIFEERKQDGWFPILPAQEITSAAELDKRNYHDSDARCYEGMGPIPVDCRAGSCGTCWIGVLGGNEKLDPADDFERKRMQYFGYWDSGFIDSDVERPLIRLACQVRANGSVSIVIPPWNAVFGESRRKREG